MRKGKKKGHVDGKKKNERVEICLSSSDRERAREMGQELINQHFGHNLKSAEEFEDSADVFYRLLQDDESSALNAGPLSECEPRPGTHLIPICKGVKVIKFRVTFLLDIFIMICVQYMISLFDWCLCCTRDLLTYMNRQQYGGRKLGTIYRLLTDLPWFG